MKNLPLDVYTLLGFFSSNDKKNINVLDICTKLKMSIRTTSTHLQNFHGCVQSFK